MAKKKTAKNSQENLSKRERQLIVGRLVREGYRNQEDIAKQLEKQYGIKVSRQTISLDLKAVRRTWLDRNAVDYDQLVAESRKNHMFCVDEARAAWEKSKQPRTKRKNVKSGGSERNEVEVEERPGDPRFLSVIQSSQQQIDKLYGLDDHILRSVSDVLQKLFRDAEGEPPTAEELCELYLTYGGPQAIAWVLERLYPDQFAKREPDTMTAEQVQYAIEKTITQVLQAVPAESVPAIQEVLRKLADGASSEKSPLYARGEIQE